MSGVVIRPKKLAGTLDIPPSKSVAHRAVIAAALARGQSRVIGLEPSQDIDATIGAMRALGAQIRLGPGEDGRLDAVIDGIEPGTAMPQIDCRESGSTLRFLIPVALAVAGGAVFTGAGRLGQRPLGPYEELFHSQGIEFTRTEGGFPLRVRGTLKPGAMMLPGGVSSQFVSGLLFALPLLEGTSEITITGTLESQPYVDITMDVLRQFGVTVQERERGKRYRVEPQQYSPRELAVEGDWSQAAFPLLMGLLGGPVAVRGLDRHSVQGDRAILDIFLDMDGTLEWQRDALVAQASMLRATIVDVSQCPDLAPAVAAAMAVAEGESRIVGGKRLRDKESDRLAAIAGCLNALGADVAQTEDGFVIHGKAELAGGVVSSANDHRIAMMAAAVSPACAGPVALEGHGAVAKSWPGFWDVFKRLGGDIDG